jgi:hypothetical protein
MTGLLNSFMEQNDKMLALVYLLKVSIEGADDQDFSSVVELLYYLSKTRRFCDTFLTTLEQIAFFGCSPNENGKDPLASEISRIFIVNHEFFDDLTPSTKIYYLSFMGNLVTKTSRPDLKSLFNKLKKGIACQLSTLINLNDLHQQILGKSQSAGFGRLTENTRESSATFEERHVDLVALITSSKSSKVFESIVRLYEKSDDFIEALEENLIIVYIQQMLEDMSSSQNIQAMPKIKIKEVLLDFYEASNLKFTTFEQA